MGQSCFAGLRHWFSWWMRKPQFLCKTYSCCKSNLRVLPFISNESFISSLTVRVGIALGICVSFSEMINFIYSWLYFAFKEITSRRFLVCGCEKLNVCAVTNIGFNTTRINVINFIGMRMHSQMWALWKCLLPYFGIILYTLPWWHLSCSQVVWTELSVPLMQSIYSYLV